MAIFLVRFSLASSNSLSNNIDKLYPYLPSKPTSEEIYHYGANEAFVFKFDAALDREPNQSKLDELILCHGYGDNQLEERIRGSFKKKQALDLNSFPEAFCAIRLTNYTIEFGGSAIGIDPLFYYEDEEQLIVTNRHNLLGNWVDKPTLRKNALAWIAGRNHIGDFGTYWNEIKRVRPGNLYTKTLKDPLREVVMDYSNIYKPISDEQIPDYIEDVANVFDEVISSNNQKLHFWLSGGKDSRAIAGLLSKSKRFKDISFSTFGEKFQPDVMSATKVAGELGILDSYQTYRSSMEEPSVNIAKNIARDLCADSSGTSLADFRSIPSSSSLIIGGHESGFKSPKNLKSLNEYLDSRKYWADGLGLLNKNTYEELNTWYTQELTSVLQNIPQARYSQMDSIVFRIGTYLSGSQGNAHVSRSEIHPFLDGRMVRLLLGVTDEALDSQLIHYSMMRRSSAVLEKIPFANDTWPSETKVMAQKIKLPFRLEPEQPYNFQKYFPSSKVFGGYSWRLELISRTKEFVYQYLFDNRTFFDFIDFNGVNELFKKELHSLHITPIYHHLSLLKICLIHLFSSGKALFDFTLEESVEFELGKLFNTSVVTSGQKVDIVSAYQKKLDSYEEAIANVAERDRCSQDNQMELIRAITAGKLSCLLSDNKTSLDLAMEDLRFIELPKNGVFLGQVLEGVKRRVHGYIIDSSLEINNVLIAIKNVSQDLPLDGFVWSNGGFWFKYLNTTLDNPEISIDLPPLNSEGEVWIMPWYTNSTIWVSNFLIKNE